MLKSSKRKFSEVLAYIRPLNPRHQAFARKWRGLEAGVVDLMWAGIQKAAARHNKPPLDASTFIAVVLSATWPPVEHLDAQDNHIRREFERLKDKMAEHVDTATSPSELRYVVGTVLPSYDDVIFKLIQSSYDFNSPAISRQDREDSRDLAAFCSRIGRYLNQRCGEWRDGDVMLLACCQFPGVSIDQVRYYRRLWAKAARKAKA